MAIVRLVIFINNKSEQKKSMAGDTFDFFYLTVSQLLLRTDTIPYISSICNTHA